ncbi:hypothetical protein [Flavobacterium sp. PL002]|uniref:hypothetical protein n=1 Tax=Flavobacterium sp. PL002 TaxID=1897058 RepID=UPI001787D8BD|nr:hypothetical protein [Flavobacterium sp. PL002]MBE0392028.1 hypothetical protein [Flavobacterium sp. PL002]
MARQKGIIKLKGTIGDITFYKTKDGHLAREKGGVEASRIANDPAFQRTRENGAEFGRAGKAGKTLRTALRGLLLNASDGKVASRLTQRMIKVIQADLVNERGLRNVIDGEAELLIGFEFNISGKLRSSLFAPFVGAIDRVSGVLSIDLASFVPANMLAAPGGTTHFKITSAGTAVNFELETFVVATSESALIKWDTSPTVAIHHDNVLEPNSVSPLFLALGVVYYQEVNGKMYPLKNGSYNPLALILISGL